MKDGQVVVVWNGRVIIMEKELDESGDFTPKMFARFIGRRPWNRQTYTLRPYNSAFVDYPYIWNPLDPRLAEKLNWDEQSLEFKALLVSVIFGQQKIRVALAIAGPTTKISSPNRRAVVFSPSGKDSWEAVKTFRTEEACFGPDSLKAFLLIAVQNEQAKLLMAPQGGRTWEIYEEWLFKN